MIDDLTLELTRRGFFGVASAALTAALAPKRAYSFLTENPVGGFWVRRTGPWSPLLWRPLLPKYITIEIGFGPVEQSEVTIVK